MNTTDKIKGTTLEQATCGVIMPNLQPCGKEAFSLITIELHNAVLCLCDEHAYGVFQAGQKYAVLEMDNGESKRYFGLEFPTPDIVKSSVQEKTTNDAVTRP